MRADDNDDNEAWAREAAHAGELIRGRIEAGWPPYSAIRARSAQPPDAEGGE